MTTGMTPVVNMSDEQLSVLRHAVGNGDRNFFGTMKDCRDGQVCESLVALGLMTSRGPIAMYGGEHVYFVTAAGKQELRGRTSGRDPVGHK